MHKNRKSTLPVVDKQETTITEDKKRTSAYIATAVIILCGVAVILGGMKIL